MSFDPNSTAAADSGIFGLPFTPEESKLHLIPVPWEVTTSYGDGASLGPLAILEASRQVDPVMFICHSNCSRGHVDMDEGKT